MEDKFEVRSYGKAELARLYNPYMCQNEALRTLSRWIRRNESLIENLTQAGARTYDKIYTPRQVSLIVSFLGEP